MHEDSSTINRKRWSKTINILQIVICGPCNIIYMCLERQSTVKDDTQTPELSIVSVKLPQLRSFDLVPTNTISVFALLTLRKLHVNHDLISERQSKREEDGNTELGLENI